MLIKALFVSALILGVSGANSQETVTAGRPLGAVVAGVAIDSVHRTPLAGASISVSGTDLSSKTDLAGQFRIAGIPTGAHFLEIRHPLLDSLAIAVTTRQREFRDGDSAFVMVGVPSAESLVRSTCADYKIERKRKSSRFDVECACDVEPAGFWTSRAGQRETLLLQSMPTMHRSSQIATGDSALAGFGQEPDGLSYGKSATNSDARQSVSGRQKP